MTYEEAKVFIDNLKICINEDLQDWKDRMWAEAIVTEPTCSKMEQVDKDINVRSKDEPQTERRCGNCKHLTYRWNKTWCDIKCDNPHDMVCDKWERSE